MFITGAKMRFFPTLVIANGLCAVFCRKRRNHPSLICLEATISGNTAGLMLCCLRPATVAVVPLPAFGPALATSSVGATASLAAVGSAPPAMRSNRVRGRGSARQRKL